MENKKSKTNWRSLVKSKIKSEKDKWRVELHKEYYKQARVAVRNNEILFFQTLEAFLESNNQQKLEFVEKILGQKLEVDSFIVGEVFNDKSEFCQLSKNFSELLLSPSEGKIIPVKVFDGLSLKEYVLLKSIDDEKIQKITSSVPIEEDKFWALAYLFLNGKKVLLGYKLKKLDKDRGYLFHVKLSSGKIFTVRIMFLSDDRFEYRGRDFNLGPWLDGDIFLYF